MPSIEKGIYYSDRKSGEGSEGWIGLYFSIYNQLTGLLCSPELGKLAANTVHISNQMISLVPDPDERVRLRKILQEEANRLKAETLKEKNTIDDSDKSRIQIAAGVYTAGFIFDILNGYVGVTKKARLAWDSNNECDKCKYKLRFLADGEV